MGSPSVAAQEDPLIDISAMSLTGCDRPKWSVEPAVQDRAGIQRPRISELLRLAAAGRSSAPIRTRNGAVASAVLGAPTRGPAYFDWRWRSDPLWHCWRGMPNRDPLK